METASEPRLRKSVLPHKAKLSPDPKYKCQANTGQQGTNNESQDQKSTFLKRPIRWASRRLRGKEASFQSRRHGFDPWVGKIRRRR